jgi:hypothetical protein
MGTSQSVVAMCLFGKIGKIEKNLPSDDADRRKEYPDSLDADTKVAQGGPLRPGERRVRRLAMLPSHKSGSASTDTFAG